MKKYLLILGVILFVSCTKPAPQLPANKFKEVDSTQIGLLSINQNLIEKEDHSIEKLAKSSGEKYTKAKSGIWYYRSQTNNKQALSNQKTAHFSYIVYTLSGKLIEKNEKTITFGKKEIPEGLEEGLKLMYVGDSMKIIVPWYLAYGLKGNESVPPYTSLIYEVKSIN